MNKRIGKIALTALTLAPAVPAFAECTPPVQIDRIQTSVDGFTHIVAKGIANIDLKNCGINSSAGLLLNYNDASGNINGKKMAYAHLLTAMATGTFVVLCSSSCDSQHPTYSTLSSIL